MNASTHPSTIYLDHAATTPLAPEVAAAMQAVLESAAPLGNPSSVHVAGRAAQQVIERSRRAVAALINAAPADLVFTSGATEADNLAVIGGARFRAHRGRHVITVATEHKAVLESAKALEGEGFTVTILLPEADGLLSIDALRDAFREDTQLVSVMHVNNETGVVQNIEAIGRLCRERDVLFHTDAAQSAGKLPLDVAALPVDLLSLTAHKFYGPQGIGALYVADRSGCGIKPLLHGGGQERFRRAGTEPVALIAGFARAAEIAAARMEQDAAHVGSLHAALWSRLQSVANIRRNGSSASSYPGILNVSVDDVEGESLMLAMEPLCVASGSACNAQSGEASAVLKALGASDLQAQGAIRFSFGRSTTTDEVEQAAEIYTDAVSRLRAIAAPATDLASARA